MPNWLDLISLVATIAVFGGIVYTILTVVQSVSQGVESAKEGLKTKGVNITDKGVSVKTSQRFDREAYMDATQKGLVNVVAASSFRKGAAAHEPGSGGYLSPDSPASLKSSPSSSSLASNGEKKKKGIFKRALSGNSNKDQ